MSITGQEVPLDLRFELRHHIEQIDHRDVVTVTEAAQQFTQRVAPGRDLRKIMTSWDNDKRNTTLARRRLDAAQRTEHRLVLLRSVIEIAAIAAGPLKTQA